MSVNKTSSNETNNSNDQNSFVQERFLNHEIDQQYNNEITSSHLELNSNETSNNNNSKEKSDFF